MTRTRTQLFLSILLLALAAPAWAADVTVTLPAGDGFVVEDNTATIERLRVDEARETSPETARSSCTRPGRATPSSGRARAIFR